MNGQGPNGQRPMSYQHLPVWVPIRHPSRKVQVVQKKGGGPLLGCPRKLGSMGYNPFINGVYWGYNPFTNHFLTSWDIQVLSFVPPKKTTETPRISLRPDRAAREVIAAESLRHPSLGFQWFTERKLELTYTAPKT